MMWIGTLFPHEVFHFLAALFLSIAFFWRFRLKKLIAIVFSVSFLVDLDHLFDYFYFAGNLSFWDYFGSTDFFEVSQKVFVLAHSWELAAIFLIWGMVKKSPSVLAISIAMAIHILIDQFSYTSNPQAYFLIFRILNNFSLQWFNSL